MSDPDGAVNLGTELLENEGMGLSSSSESDSEGFSTDVSDWAWERARELCSLSVGTNYSMDVCGNRRWKGRRGIKNASGVA